MSRDEMKDLVSSLMIDAGYAVRQLRRFGDAGRALGALERLSGALDRTLAELEGEDEGGDGWQDEFTWELND